MFFKSSNSPFPLDLCVRIYVWKVLCHLKCPKCWKTIMCSCTSSTRIISVSTVFICNLCCLYLSAFHAGASLSYLCLPEIRCLTQKASSKAVTPEHNDFQGLVAQTDVQFKSKTKQKTQIIHIISRLISLCLLLSCTAATWRSATIISHLCNDWKTFHHRKTCLRS